MDPSVACSRAFTHTKGIESVFYELCRAKPLDETFYSSIQLYSERNTHPHPHANMHTKTHEKSTDKLKDSIWCQLEFTHVSLKDATA